VFGAGIEDAEEGKMKRSFTALLLALVLGLVTAFVVTAGLSKFASAGDNANSNGSYSDPPNSSNKP
jgi:hypothetical protein